MHSSLLVVCLFCFKDDDSTELTKTIDPGNDPNFTIVSNSDTGLKI